MMRMRILPLLALALVPVFALAQTPVDATLLSDIRAIRAIDNHSHIPPAPPALPEMLAAEAPFGKPEFLYPLRLRGENHEWRAAWRALYGVDARDGSVATNNTVLRRKRALIEEHGARWPGVVMDRSNIDIALVNMPALAPHEGKRLLWVPHANALLSPFGKTRAALPPTFRQYVEHARAKLRDWRAAGAVAVKLSVAYDRPLDFSVASEKDAARVYEKYAAATGAGVPTATEYKPLQDHLFRVVAQEAGALGLVVHVHTGIGADQYFNIRGSNPLLLEDALNDPALRATKFVLIHGGWPFDREAGTMLIKPNVYADFSAHTFLRYPHSLAETLRGWLEWYPEKVLYGTDAYPDPGTPINSWEEMMYFANDSARQALAIALGGMIADGAITRVRALEIARMVLRGNAQKLYGLE